MCVPSSWVLFGMLLLPEVSQVQSLSVFIKGKLHTDHNWAAEAGTGYNT